MKKQKVDLFLSSRVWSSPSGYLATWVPGCLGTWLPVDVSIVCGLCGRSWRSLREMHFNPIQFMQPLLLTSKF